MQLVMVAALVAIAFWVYLRIALRLAKSGGAVRSESFIVPDLIMSIVVAGFFGFVSVASWLSAPREAQPIHIDQVLLGSLNELMVVVLVAAFFYVRGADLVAILGLKRVPLLPAACLALLLCLAAQPLVFLTNSLTTQFLKSSAEEQELVKLFRDEAHLGHHSGMAKIFIAGVILAPLIEEFLFRGCFYAIFKKYMGPVAAAMVSAGLFAAFHTNLASFPGLFVLAICFTLAYERSGSLLVPMGMHAIFNLSSLALIYGQAMELVHS
jgi:membrane protease YdiL (CAAX protease family)